MEKIALVTDSSCDLPEQILEKYNIHVIPLHIIFKDGDYRDGIDITPREFYEKLNIEEIPSTSMPSPGEIWKLFFKIKRRRLYPYLSNSSFQWTKRYFLFSRKFKR